MNPSDLPRPAVPRIALFMPDFSGGGVERVMLTLAAGFIDRGYTVSLIVMRAYGVLASQVPAGTALVELGCRKPRQAIRPLIRWLRIHRPAVLLSSPSQLHWVSALAVSLAGANTVCVVREASTISMDIAHLGAVEGWMRKILQRLICRDARVIALSQQAAADLSRVSGRELQTIRVIPNPIVDRSLYDEAAGSSGHSWLDRKTVPVIVAAGRLHHQKGFDTLLHAMKQLLCSRRVRLIILGEGDQRGKLTELCQELGLQEYVSLPGFAPRIMAFLARADLFVLSSRWEGLPGVLIQALAVGTPIVATDCPSGPREILDNGRYGTLVPVDEPEAMATALRHALEGESRQKAPESWLERYRVDTAVTSYLAEMGLPAYATAR